MLAYIYIYIYHIYIYIYGYIPIYQHHGSVMGVEVFFSVNRILGYPETQPPPMISGEFKADWKGQPSLAMFTQKTQSIYIMK